MDLNLNHLRIFREVAEAGSVSGAAARLMISQPAVSKQLATFEANLGLPLVERLGRGIRLTAAGEVLAQYARRIATLEQEAIEAVRELRGGSRGTIRVGASTTVAVYLLPEAIVAFRKQHPGVEMRLSVASSAEIARRVGEGELDVGFVEVAPEREGLAWSLFRKDELVAIAGTSHPLARKRRVTLKELCAQPFVVRDTGSETKSFVERELASRGLTVSAAMSVGSTEAVKRAVAAGIGIGIVSKLAIDLEVKAKRLAVLPVKELGIRRPLYRVVRQRSPAFAALDAFVNEVV